MLFSAASVEQAAGAGCPLCLYKTGYHLSAEGPEVFLQSNIHIYGDGGGDCRREDFDHPHLFPFSLYIVTHELIHIVRFTKFMQNFVATADEKMDEEMRVHKKTHDILGNIRISGLSPVLAFYNQWHTYHDKLLTQKESL